MEFSDTITIYRPVETVWQCLLDLDHYPAWYPGLTTISGTLAPDEILQLDLTLGSRRIRPRVRIIAFEPGRVLAWRGSLFGESPLQPLFSIIRRFEMHPVDATTTHFSNRERFCGIIGAPLGLIGRSRLEPRYHMLNRSLREHCKHCPLEEKR